MILHIYLRIIEPIKWQQVAGYVHDFHCRFQRHNCVDDWIFWIIDGRAKFKDLLPLYNVM